MWYLWEVSNVLCVKCRKWIDRRCVKVKRATLRLGRDFACGRCKKQADGFMDSVEELCEEVEMVRGFCYLGDRVNAGIGCSEAAVTAKSKNWLGEVQGIRGVAELKKVLAKAEKNGLSELYKISDVIYGSETWRLRENEIAILRRTERAIVRAMCGAKLMEKTRTEDLMEILGLKETAVQMAKANGVRWYGHVLRRDDGHILRKALEFEVRGKRKPG